MKASLYACDAVSTSCLHHSSRDFGVAVPRGEQGLHSSKNSTRSPREITLILLLYLIVHKPLLLWFRWISFDYRVHLGFGSIAGGLDHVNPVIRLPIERGISKVIRLVLGIAGINHYDWLPYLRDFRGIQDRRNYRTN
ncbi:hypothetical protein Tco_0614570 [Tanacetum coccineum]